MNDFERRDEQFDDQVQIEHLDLSDPTGCATSLIPEVELA